MKPVNLANKQRFLFAKERYEKALHNLQDAKKMGEIAGLKALKKLGFNGRQYEDPEQPYTVSTPQGAKYLSKKDYELYREELNSIRKKYGWKYIAPQSEGVPEIMVTTHAYAWKKMLRAENHLINVALSMLSEEDYNKATASGRVLETQERYASKRDFVKQIMAWGLEEEQ